MTTILKAPTAADFLAMVPYLVGVDPHDSVVLVGFKGKRTAGAMRFGLPPLDAPEVVLKRFITTMVGTFCKIPDLDAAAIVIFTVESFGKSSTPPYDRLGYLLGERLHRMGFHIKEALCQASDGWGSLWDSDAPAGGHPLQDVLSSSILQDLPDELRLKLPSREGPARIPDASENEQERMRASLEEYRAVVHRSSAYGGMPLPPDLDGVADLPRFVEDALDWDDDEIHRWGPVLIFLTASPALRDHCVFQWATDRHTGEMLYDWATSGPVGTRPELDKVFGGLLMGEGPQPNPERLNQGIQLMLALVPLLTGSDRLAPLCMITWLHWALGRGSVAGVYLDEAISIDRTYGMVEVLATMLNNGMLPEWAFHG